MLIALINTPSPRITECELTYLERQAIDYPRSLEQHRAYAHALESCGARVRVLTVNTNCPDGAFVEDVAIVLDETAVICSMGAASRRGEIDGLAPELARFRTLKRIELPATLEGGDVVRAGRILFVGVSRRTNAAGIECLRDLVEPHGYQVVPLEIRECLHLKSACTAIHEKAVLANPSWLSPDSLACIRAAQIEIVSVAREEPGAANVLPLPRGLLLSASHPRTAEILAQRGCNVRPVDLSEFAKAEACTTCLSLVFESGS